MIPTPESKLPGIPARAEEATKRERAHLHGPLGVSKVVSRQPSGLPAPSRRSFEPLCSQGKWSSLRSHSPA